MTEISGIGTTATAVAAGDKFEKESAGGTGEQITAADLAEGLAPLSGCPVLIEEHVFASSGANHTFSSIPATYRDLMIVVRGRGTTAAINASVQLVFNGDTGANYDRQQSNITTSFLAATNTFGSTAGVIGDITASTAAAGCAGLIEARIGDYRGTTFHKVSNCRAQRKTGTSAGDYMTQLHSMTWRSTSAITSILVQLGAGDFAAGSVISLYGIP
jgi:hypothetical protein